MAAAKKTEISLQRDLINFFIQRIKAGIRKSGDGGAIPVRLALLVSSSIEHLNKVSTKLGAAQTTVLGARRRRSIYSGGCAELNRVLDGAGCVASLEPSEFTGCGLCNCWPDLSQQSRMVDRLQQTMGPASNPVGKTDPPLVSTLFYLTSWRTKRNAVAANTEFQQHADKIPMPLAAPNTPEEVRRATEREYVFWKEAARSANTR